MIQLAQAYNLRGILYRQLGRFDDAIASYGRSLSVYDQVDHRAGQTRAHNNRGVLLQDMGRWPEALVDFDASLEYSEETGEAWWQAAALLNKGEIYRRQGHLHAANKVLEKAYEIGDEHNLGEIVGLTLMNLGAVYLREGNLDKAEVKIAEAGRQFEDIQARGHIVEIQRWETELTMKREQWPEAMVMAEQGLKAAQKTGRTLEIAHAYRRLGTIYRHLKRCEEAKYVLDESLQRTEQMNAPYEKGLALFELARLKAGHSDHFHEVLVLCDEVIALWLRLGAEIDLVEAQALRSTVTSAKERGL